MISVSLWCFRSLLVEEQRDGMATGTECRLTRERDGHSAKRDSTSNKS